MNDAPKAQRCRSTVQKIRLYAAVLQRASGRRQLEPRRGPPARPRIAAQSPACAPPGWRSPGSGSAGSRSVRSGRRMNGEPPGDDTGERTSSVLHSGSRRHDSRSPRSARGEPRRRLPSQQDHSRPPRPTPRARRGPRPRIASGDGGRGTCPRGMPRHPRRGARRARRGPAPARSRRTPPRASSIGAAHDPTTLARLRGGRRLRGAPRNTTPQALTKHASANAPVAASNTAAGIAAQATARARWRHRTAQDTPAAR